MSSMTCKTLLAAVVLLTCGCADAPEPSAESLSKADLVMVNGDIYTVDAARSWADAVAVKGEHIIYVGTDAGAQPFIGGDTKVVDLDGRMVLPGFQDVHVHPPSSGVSYLECPLFDHDTLESLLGAIRNCVEENPDAPYIRGEGWYVTFFPEGVPHKKLLDEIESERPLYLSSADGHSMWVNTKALEVMGITKDTPDPHGGRIERDPVTGEPIGVLQEDPAMSMAWEYAPYSEEVIEAGLRYAVKHLNSLGITSAQDAIVKLDGNDAYRSLEAYAKLDESGELTLRSVLALLWEIDKGPEQIPPLVAAREKYTRGNVSATSIKFWLDGVMETKTAALIEPYLDGDNIEPNMTEEDLNARVADLDALGFQLHVHAIGDATIRASLDAFEHARAANGVRDSRHHICHLQLIHPEDIPRFRELNVVANFQPLWAIMDEYVTRLTIPRLGEARSRWLYPIKSVLDAGGMVAFGSDWYVSTADPLPQIETAITREDASGEDPGVLVPQERIGLHDAIAAFTINAAYVNSQDDTTGSVEVGKLADLVVLDKNLFTLEPEAISDAKVLLTLFGGRPVHGELSSL